jgi:hypothetical protein
LLSYRTTAVQKLYGPDCEARQSFFELVPLWGAWCRNRPHIHNVWWWSFVASQWICELSE